MNDFTMTFRGTRSSLDQLIEEITTLDGVSRAAVERVSGATGEVLGRDPLNQIEIVDVVVAFTVNLAATYTYEQIRTALRARAASSGFAERTGDEQDDRETD